MKALLVVAGLASAVAVVSGVLLMSAPRDAGDPAGTGAGSGVRPGPEPSPGARFPSAAAVAEEAAVREALEKRVRELEIRVDELQGRLLLSASPGGGGAWIPGGDGRDAAGDAAAEGPSADASPGEEGGAEVEDGAAGSGDGEAIRRIAEGLQAHRAELRREAEIQKRIDRMASTMDLQPVERERLDAIVRAHVEKAGEVGSRARDLFRESPFGLTPADRAALTQLQQDRRAVDKETEQAILGLVGVDRWKKYRTSVKEQADKERALKRLDQPW